MKWGSLLAVAFALAGIPVGASAYGAQPERLAGGPLFDMPWASRAAPPRAVLRLSSRRAAPGTRIRLRGRSLTRRRMATIAFGGRRLRRVRTGRRGGLRTAIRVPRRAPGIYTVSARTGRRVARVRFVIPTPRVPAAAPASAPVRESPISQAPAGPAPEPPPLEPPALDPEPEAPFTVAAAGDIACRPGDPAAGDFRCRHLGTSNRVISLDPDVVSTLGDTQYETSTSAEFAASYDPTWGRVKSRTRPTVGNHEYQGDPSRSTANGYYGYFGPAAGRPTQGYYSYDIGDWKAIVLNTGSVDYTITEGGSALPDDCYPVSCAEGSAQVMWLRGLLESLPADKCIVASWHHPRYDSLTRYSYDELIPIYDALYDGGAELALTGHDHSYERFAPMTADNTVDEAFGVRQFIVGIGGKDRRFVEPTTLATGSELRESNGPPALYGVLELELEATRYEFRLVGEDGAIRDQGSRDCHGRPAP